MHRLRDELMGCGVAPKLSALVWEAPEAFLEVAAV